MFLKNTKHITVQPFIPEYKDDKQKSNKHDFVMQTNSGGQNSPKAKINLVKQLSKVLAPGNNSAKKKTKIQNSQQQRTFLVSQNKLLKQQTLDLINQLSSLLGQIKPKKYGINIYEQNQTPEIKLKKAKLANQQIKISQLQLKLAFQKKQLEYVYDDANVKVKQSEVKILQKQFKQLQKEKNGILNISKAKSKHIQSSKMSPQFQQRVNRTKEQLAKLKDQCKTLTQKTLQNERLLRKKHEKVVSKQNKIKFIQKKIKQNQQKIKRGQTSKIVTVQMISEIQSQISQLEEERLLSEQSWKQKMTNLDHQLSERTLELQKKEIILKDKQKQVRLNQLRIKQLKKLVMNQNTQINRRSSMTDGEDTTKSKGRVRNIKRLEQQATNPIAQKK